MAAPESITLKTLNGSFVMNKKLSDNFEPILSLQGIGWVTRKAIGVATITLHVKQYEEEGVTHIDIDQIATGGVKGTAEKRQLTWEQREHYDHVFGQVKGQCRYVKLDQIDDEFLKSHWAKEMEGAEFIEDNVQSMTNDWVAHQLWGFQEIDGKRYYARMVVVTKGNERKTARLIYDYQSK